MSEQVDALSPAGVSALATFIIRPPRAVYSRSELGERAFMADEVPSRRDDLTLTNARGHTLQASHFRPAALPIDTPTVVYLHGNGSCRVEATMLIPHVLPYGLALFAFDFAGSGRSEGDFISLGVHEKHDVETVVHHLVSVCGVKRIVLWGHSMGAATAVMYAGLCERTDALVALVLDSPFASFDKLAHSMVAEMPIPLAVPRKLILSVGVRAVRKVVRDRANFDVYDIDPLSAARKITRNLPAIFLHGSADVVVPLSHGQLLHKNYPSPDKSLLVLKDFEHDTQRPEWAMDRVFVFLQRHLREHGPRDLHFLDQLKGRGNVAMLAGRFADAVYLYSEALNALSDALTDRTRSPPPVLSDPDDDDPSQNLVRRTSSISNFVGNVKRWRSARVAAAAAAAAPHPTPSAHMSPRAHKRLSREHDAPTKQARLRPLHSATAQHPPDDASSIAVSANDFSRSDSSAWSGRFSRKSKNRPPSRARSLLSSLRRKIAPTRSRASPTSTPPSESAAVSPPYAASVTLPPDASPRSPDGTSTVASEPARPRPRAHSAPRGTDSTSSRAFLRLSVNRVRSVSRLTRSSNGKDADRPEGSVASRGAQTADGVGRREKPAYSFDSKRRAATPDGSNVRNRFSVGDTNVRPGKNRQRTGSSPRENALGAIDISGWELDPDRKALALALLGNRSLARRKVGDVHGALFDAITSLRLDPTWVRGYLRKAAALRQDDKLSQARRCVLDGLLQEPQHAGLIDMLQSIDDAVAAEQIAKVNEARDVPHLEEQHNVSITPIAGSA